MKTFTSTNQIGHDLVHMVGSKDDYVVTENSETIKYTSKMGDREYIVTGSEEIRFKRPDSQGKTNYTWAVEFEPFGIKKSCKEWLDSGSTTNGIYKIKPSDTEFDVFCDMTTDGGGWTLVSYAGIINTNKAVTTGQGDKLWHPLIFNWGNVETNSVSTRKSFSRFDIVKSMAKSTDEIRARRTSNNYTLIFPITNVDWFGRDSSEGHFDINETNRNLAYLKLNNGTGLKTVSNGTKWSYVNSNSSSYPGIDWNVSEGENCDNCGRSYSTALNHRSLLYWETNDASYSDNQWFHASPMSLADSTGPDNSVQDIEFWYREV